MRRNDVRRLVLGGLIAGLGAWLILPRVFHSAGPAAALASSSDAAGAFAAVAAPPTESPAIDTALQELVAAPWPDNPFCGAQTAHAEEQKPEQQPPVPPMPVLQAIVGGATPHALLNGQIVRIGDQLADGSVVTAIGAYTVTFQGPQGDWSLELSP